MKNKLKTFIALASVAILTGCTCVHTHVPGRVLNHGPHPDGVDTFFCILDDILFPTPPQVVVVPAPEPVVVAPAPAPVRDCI